MPTSDSIAHTQIGSPAQSSTDSLVSSSGSPAHSSPDQLITKATSDFKAVAHGASTEALRDDLQNIWRRDTARGVPLSKWSQDISVLNQQLQDQQLLPNLSIVSVDQGRVMVLDGRRSGQYAVLTDGMGMTQVEDLKSPYGAMQVQRAKPLSEDALFKNLTPSGVIQGKDIGDCRFEAQLTALAKNDPEAIKRMVQSNKDGTYTVTFSGDPSHPEQVPAPTPWERATFSSGGAEWASVVEKAYRQRTHEPFGAGNDELPNFAGLLTGRSATFVAVQDLPTCDSVAQKQDEASNSPVCRENVQKIPLKDAVEKFANKLTSVDRSDLSNFLQSALTEHMLLTTAFATKSLDNGTDQNREGTDNLGQPVDLFPKHDYTVMNYDARSQMVTLRNPWGVNMDSQTGNFTGDGLVSMPLAQFARIVNGFDVEKSSLSP